jgi:hypothetical protein
VSRLPEYSRRDQESFSEPNLVADSGVYG